MQSCSKIYIDSDYSCYKNKVDFSPSVFFCFQAAVVCVTLLNRLEGDQIKASHEVLAEYQRRPQQLIATLIKKRLGLINDKELLDNAVV